MTTLARISLISLILILAFLGGLSVYTTAGAIVMQVLIILAIGLALLVIMLRGAVPYLAVPGLIIWVTMATAAMLNFDIWRVESWQLALAGAAVGAIILAQYFLEEKPLREALALAGWLWAGLWAPALLLGWSDNWNTVAFWPFLFAMVALRGDSGKPALLALMTWNLIWTGSRGALLGLAVGALAYFSLTVYKPRAINLFSLTGLLAFGLLIARRPETAGYRLHYWQQAWQAFLDNPGGVGPGGLWARHLITEPGAAGYHFHAHNIVLSWLAETGLIGTLGASLAAVAAVVIELSPWKLALLAGLLAWSMVDQPLFWPGPLLATALVIGAREQ